MAVNRCYDTFTPNKTSSDYMNYTRQSTIFNEVNRNITKLGTANPKKKNGFRYNSNFGVRGNKDNNTGCLAFSNNYDLLLDITKGKTINNNENFNCNGEIPAGQVNMNAPIFNAWSGNLYSVDYSKLIQPGEESIVLATYDPSYCVIDVDPSHVLFYDSCPLTESNGYPPKWFQTVDISFNDTTYYKEANQDQIYHGLNYPEKVTFGTGPM
jgi:hypothetical protein